MQKMTQTNSRHTRARRIGDQLRRIGLNNFGNSLVELALVMPIYILLLGGAVEFGRLAYFDVEISNAARAGVAYGSQSLATASNTTAIETAAKNDAPNLTNVAAITFSPAPAVVCQCDNAGTFTNMATCGSACSPGRIVQYVKVNTSATVNSLLHYPGLGTSYTLTGQAIMRIK
jgi:Flp pilus assembly protein TadG